MKRYLRAIQLVLLVAMLTSCGGGGERGTSLESWNARTVGDIAPQNAGSIRLALTDATACGFEHVWVTVERIRMYQTSAAANADNGSGDLVLSPPRRIDLLTLTGGLLEEIGTASLPSGHYESLRLVLTANGPAGAPDSMANAVQPTGGSPVPLTTPSATQSGLKVQFKFDVAPGQVTDVVLDFDACKSVVSAGNSGQFILKPVLTARPRTAGFAVQPAQLVNTTTAGDQVDPHVAALANGGYVVAWTDWPAAPSFAGVIHAQRYDAAGTKLGGELLLYEDASAGGVTGLPNGGFALAMSQQNSNVGYALALQIDASGAATGPAQTVITAGTPDFFLQGGAVDIDVLPGGGYLVAGYIFNPRPPADSTFWVGHLNASGAPLGAAVQVGGGTFAGNFSTRALLNGGWVSAWDAEISPFSPQPYFRTFVNVFSSAGEQVASIAINPDLQGDEFSPGIATLRDGNFVVAWGVSPFTAGTTLPPVQLQLFDQGGTATSPIIDVGLPRSVGSGLQLTPLASGGFLLSFPSIPDSTSSVITVLGQVFDATGHASGPSFQLGTATSPNSQIGPRFVIRRWEVAPTPDGGFVFAYELPGTGTGEDIYLKKFTPAIAL